MGDCFIIIIQFACLAVIYFCSRYSRADSFKQGTGVFLGRCATIVTIQKGCIISVRTYDSDLLEILSQRKDTVVMKQYH